MASLTEFRKVARQVCNWGRWGDADELGTLNFITAEKVAEAASLVKHGKVFPLGVDFGSGGPQGAFQFRHNPMHVMTVDGGDASTLARYGPRWARNSVAQQLSGYFEDNPFRFNDDMIIMPLQAATQWDALSHVYYDDQLYNGFPRAQSPASVRITAVSTKLMARASPREECCWISSGTAVRKRSWSWAIRSVPKNWTRSLGLRE
ncbi:cyclase family protein [Mycobacterium xenopi 4042]|uniref:Cyclase family protein n=1 Tax=Mycobacterium xenopi 4042 TaxID=1299334 RepID=X8AHY4_MYCXE|nr:cyclase family protein [Mycobacterium xenopi 4042]